MQFISGKATLETRQFYNGQECMITLGSFSYINGVDLRFSKLHGHALIGNFCSLSWDLVFLIGYNHNYRFVSTYPFRGWSFNREETNWAELPYPMPDPNRYQIIIGSDVWIGRGVTVLGGVKIGNGAVIGANSTVTKDIPPYAIAVGSPARVIKYRFDADMIKKLSAIKWWNWSPEKIRRNIRLLEFPKQFVDEFYSPELEYFSEDNLGRQLTFFRNTGGEAEDILVRCRFPSRATDVETNNPGILECLRARRCIDACHVDGAGRNAKRHLAIRRLHQFARTA